MEGWETLTEEGRIPSSTAILSVENEAELSLYWKAVSILLPEVEQQKCPFPESQGTYYLKPSQVILVPQTENPTSVSPPPW